MYYLHIYIYPDGSLAAFGIDRPFARRLPGSVLLTPEELIERMEETGWVDGADGVGMHIQQVGAVEVDAPHLLLDSCRFLSCAPGGCSRPSSSCAHGPGFCWSALNAASALHPPPLSVAPAQLWLLLFQLFFFSLFSSILLLLGSLLISLCSSTSVSLSTLESLCWRQLYTFASPWQLQPNLSDRFFLPHLISFSLSLCALLFF